MQEALVSQGCTKAEAAAAEQLYKLLTLQNEDAEAQKGKSAAASPRATAVVLPDAEATSPAVSARDSSGSSARSSAVAGPSKAMTAGVSLGDGREVVDYDMFEQLWMADLANPMSKP